MASAPPKRATAYTFYISLGSQADTDIFKTSVTLAAGDVTISKDGGAFANIGSLPVEIGTSGVLAVALTASEMDADVIVVRFSDVAGAEWQDATVMIPTVTSQIDDLATAAILALIQADTDDIQTRIPAALVSGKMDSSVSAVTAAGLSDFFDVDSGVTYAGAVAGSVVKEIADNAGSAGAGAISQTLNVTDGTNPLDGVEVWVTTDVGGTNVVASGNTDALGNVVFMLDAGTYYAWKQLSGYSFTNPQSFTVS